MDNTSLTPVITEKPMRDVKSGKFTFKVARHVDKKEVRNAIEKKFKVSVTGISTSLVKGRTMKTGSRRVERELTSWKKAIVTLKKGEKIDLFEKA